MPVLPDPGQNLSINISDGDMIDLHLEAVVEEKNGSRLLIRALEGGTLMPLQDARKVELGYSAGGSFCRVPATIVDAGDPSQPVESIWVEAKGSITEIQRRGHFRLNVSFPVRWRKIEIPATFHADARRRRWSLQDFNEALNRNSETGRTLDLSGGGMAMTAAPDIVEGNEIYVEVMLPTGPIRSAAKVIRVEPKMDEDFPTDIIRMAFVGLNNREEGSLMQFLMNEQIREKRKSKEEE